MKDVKITNFTTKDYCVLALINFCGILLFSECIIDFKDGQYMHAVGAALGTLGWIMLSFRKTKKIRDKNPQDKD